MNKIQQIPILPLKQSTPDEQSFTMTLPCFRDGHVFLSDYFAQHCQNYLRVCVPVGLAEGNTANVTSYCTRHESSSSWFNCGLRSNL